MIILKGSVLKYLAIMPLSLQSENLILHIMPLRLNSKLPIKIVGMAPFLSSL